MEFKTVASMKLIKVYGWHHAPVKPFPLIYNNLPKQYFFELPEIKRNNFFKPVAFVKVRFVLVFLIHCLQVKKFV